MALSVLLAADSLKAVIPCSLLSASMLPFASLSLGIGSLSWVVPKKTFLAMDNTLYRAYMRLCLFVFENVSGVELRLHGDLEVLKNKEESVLVLSNHQTNVDWAIIMMLADRQGKDGSSVGFRVMVKNAIHYVPLFGWYIFQHGYIYVRRFGTFIGTPVLKQLKWLDSIGECYWLLVFPEGTRFTKNHPEKIKQSQEFCRTTGMRELENVLCPRVGGVQMAVENLKSLDAIYDITIGYGQTRNRNRRGYAPGMFEFVCGALKGRYVSVHIKRHSINDVPKDKLNLKNWMMEIYENKDKLMNGFYETGEFPDKIDEIEPALPIMRTLPPTLFFSGALLSAYYLPFVRNIYKYTLATFPLLILWLKVRKCV